MVILILLNIYQYLVQRAALRIAEILFVMSRNVREKAKEVRLDGKDVEIIEAHLFDVATSARSLLKALGRSEKSIDPDPMLSISSTYGHRIVNVVAHQNRNRQDDPAAAGQAMALAGKQN